MGLFSRSKSKKPVVGEPKVEEVKEEPVVEMTKEEAPPGDDEKKEDAMTKKDVVALLKEEYKVKKIPKAWLVFTGVTVLLLALTLLWWGFSVLKLLWFLAKQWRTFLKVLYYVAKYALITLKNVVFPIVCILGNVWVFRNALIRAAVRLAKEKKGFILRNFIIDGRAQLKEPREMEVALRNVGLKVRFDEPEEMLSFDKLSVNLTQNDPKKLFFDLDVVLDGLQINLVTFDVRFKDTNLSRFLAALQGDDEDETPQQEKKDDEAPATTKQDQGGEQRLHITARLKNVKICAKSSGKVMGTRQLGAPITIDEEVIDLDMLKSKRKLITWINVFVIRQVASGAFNIGTSAVDGASMLVNGVTNGLLGGVDTVADKVPGGSVIKGGTGAVRSVVGGTLGGVSKVTHGVAGGGKAIVGGITSGSVSGMKEGFAKAGNEVGGGLMDGAKSVGGGVHGAGTSVAGGVTKAAGKKRSQSQPPPGREESKSVELTPKKSPSKRTSFFSRKKSTTKAK